MVLKLFDEQTVELTSKIGGVILRKAEFVNDFTAVYSMVFEKLDQLGEIQGDEFLSILGEIGG